MRKALAAVAIALAGCGAGSAPEQRVEPAAVVDASVPVGERGNGIMGMAAGGGAVWVATAGGCVGSLTRVDAQTAEVTSAIDLGEVFDVALAAGSVWALADPCDGEPALLRLDPDTGRTLARVPLELGRAVYLAQLVAAGGSLWVGMSDGPTRGEIVRIDPEANVVAERIDARGHVGDMAAAGDHVWFLSHPEWTDETRIRSATLHRIDVRTNEVAAIPPGAEVFDLGGTMVGPRLAAGTEAAWLSGHEARPPHRSVAVRVDARTGVVTRRTLPFTHFYPLAAVDEGVWFLGSDGVARLDGRTLRRVTEPIAIDRHIGDAAQDGDLWLAGLAIRYTERSVAIRVRLP